MKKLTIDEQMRLLLKGLEEVISEGELRAKLEKSETTGEPLIVKLGLDPTAPDIHLGHSVVLRKAKQFQDLGHKVIIIIGDFTGMIGDPSGKSKTRKPLTRDEVLINAETYRRQLFKILDPDFTEVRFNSEWLECMSFKEVIELMAKQTVARILERDDFKNRFNNNQSIGLHEFTYPLMQGLDSVIINADVELGGTDQTFNILMGRTLQKEYNKEKQVAMFVPILEGTDGKEKMSKSLGNYIGVNENPKEIFGKVMSVPDELIIRYFELVTDVHPDEIDVFKKQLEEGTVNPRDLKLNLAEIVVSLYHGSNAGKRAREEFISIFSNKSLPKDIEEIQCPDGDCICNKLIQIILKMSFANTNREARRLISQGAIKINGEKFIEDECFELKAGDVIQVGKKRFVKIKN
ncbi:tyrosine--tRNA ligase [Oceanirhabdus seepicola]|uniref:Tyrosine--tRNA ligase n=1 Tax=Oceanirhabdus seepicola TaxID=2828781 RepID=A0A9J6P5N0_9CLOT|nr:tyrosine--tRNA ligase [Oceanirhabdus seepicola]MCM1991891.1 tyrosine--tRNA ligase [Oceanirhabdus seepicola]